MRTWPVWALLIASALVWSLAAPAVAQGIGHFGARPFGPWVWAVGTFFLLRALLVVGLVIVIWRLLASRALWQRPDSAVQILRERYARGEVSEDEYRKRLTTLS